MFFTNHCTLSDFNVERVFLPLSDLISGKRVCSCLRITFLCKVLGLYISFTMWRASFLCFLFGRLVLEIGCGWVPVVKCVHKR